MRNLIFLALFYNMLFITSPAGAQGKIVYLNGKEKRFQSAELKGEYIVYKPEDSSRPRRSDRYNVFSIVRDNGTEELIYTPDTLVSDDPSVTEVREYIMGEQFARQTYKKHLNLAGGFVAGAAGSALGFYGLIVPVIYPTIVGRFTPKPPASASYNPDPQTGRFEIKPLQDQSVKPELSEAFIAGYGKQARNIKIKKSLIGGGIGFAAGITTLLLILGNDD